MAASCRVDDGPTGSIRPGLPLRPMLPRRRRAQPMERRISGTGRRAPVHRLLGLERSPSALRLEQQRAGAGRLTSGLERRGRARVRRSTTRTSRALRRSLVARCWTPKMLHVRRTGRDARRRRQAPWEESTMRSHNRALNYPFGRKCAPVGPPEPCAQVRILPRAPRTIALLAGMMHLVGGPTSRPTTPLDTPIALQHGYNSAFPRSMGSGALPRRQRHPLVPRARSLGRSSSRNRCVVATSGPAPATHGD